MKAPSVTSRIFMVIAAVVMLMMSASLAWAVVSDYQAHGQVPQGVTVAGQDLGGMTEDQARAAMETAVSTPMLRPVTVTGDTKSWTLDPTKIVAVDVDAMVNEAYTSRRSATFVRRLDSQLRGTPLPMDVKPAFSIDSSAVAEWVAATAKELDRQPKDATRTIVAYTFKITPGVDGLKVDQAASADEITKALGAEAALAGSERAAALVVTATKPKITESSFKTAIIVSTSKCRIWLFEGAKMVKTYPCAPGRPAFPTPKGDFIIQSKQHMAPWYNPGSDWAKSMPPMIPGGPSNPMGIDKIGINSSGIFFHGIPRSEYSSIGTQASHGCMRMMPSAVKDLMTRVDIGDQVYIRR
jgi:lipoprotein-anchoring transpeptidase ErfK/SrfK